METQNETKAKEIAKASTYLSDFPHHEKSVEYGALEAMEWKDRMFQKVLDYAEVCYGVFSFEQREKFIKNIKEIYYKKE